MSKTMEMVSEEDVEGERILGVLWDLQSDMFRFSVRINLSHLKNKS